MLPNIMFQNARGSRILKRTLLVLFTLIFTINIGAMERIAIQRLGTNGEGYFYLNETGQKIVLRGANYVRLTHLNGREHHSTFAPGLYNTWRAETMLRQLEQDQYNTVRVFIDPGDWAPYGWSKGVAGSWNNVQGLSSAYMQNVADFVIRAHNHNIYVLPVLERFPFNQYYQDIRNKLSSNDINGYNGWYLNKGYVTAKKQYVKDFVQALKSRIGVERMSAIAAYSIGNEAYFDSSAAPFNSFTRSVKTANGLTYSMRTAASRQQAADANVNYWINQMSQAVKSEDPQALVTLGAFTFRAIGRNHPDGLMPYPTNDRRYPIRPLTVMRWSNLDFFDLHIYPKPTNYSLDQDVQSSEYSGTYGPVLLGEFGALKSAYSNNIYNAAGAMKNFQKDTCRYNFAGWLFWTYDTDDNADQRRFFNLKQNAGAMNGVLAPIARPNPCR